MTGGKVTGFNRGCVESVAASSGKIGTGGSGVKGVGGFVMGEGITFY